MTVLASLLRRILPHNDYGDLIYFFLKFIIRHRRLPRNRNVFNDVLFRLQRSKQLGSPLRVFVSDKEYVKVFVKSVVGEEYNVSTLAVLETDYAIDNYAFPENCCVKATHGSGMTVIRRNDSYIDRDLLKSWLSLNYYKRSREINYKTLQPKIIVEPILWDKENLDDYKFFCFNGKVGMIQVDLDRHINHTRLLFDRNWTPMSYGLQHPKPSAPCPKPANIAQMIEVAEALSARFDFVRVDLYSDGKSCRLGEITNCHGGGSEAFVPPSAEFEASKLIFG